MCYPETLNTVIVWYVPRPVIVWYPVEIIAYKTNTFTSYGLLHDVGIWR